MPRFVCRSTAILAGSWAVLALSTGTAAADTGATAPPGRQQVTVLSVRLGALPAGSIPAGSIPAGSIPAGSIPIGSIPIIGTPAGGIPALLEGLELTIDPGDAEVPPTVTLKRGMTRNIEMA